jgi:hypothetical protein
MSCQNCSIAGTVEITEGVFHVNSTTIEAFQAVNFIENGYFKAVANGVNAHIELDTTLSLSSTQSFDNTLSTIALPGFQVRLTFILKVVVLLTKSRFLVLQQSVPCSSSISLAA